MCLNQRLSSSTLSLLFFVLFFTHSTLAAPPFGAIATPIEGSTVRGTIPVTGWALDDVEVASVKIYRVDGASLVYLSDAALVEGARPDVAAAYPHYPNRQKAGWSFSLPTHFLPDGGNSSYTLHVTATDNQGNEVTLGTRTILTDNNNGVKPFGNLDTPLDGATVSGTSYVNWGWVLTPQPNNIPTDGSTISVYIDGVNVGHPTYNIYRADIATGLPGYANSNGAAGSFTFDTTAYADGVHSIQWIATDSAANSDSIGARYFVIQNGPAITAPIVTTTAITGTTDTAATGGGNISSDGGAAVTERGICWSTSENPLTIHSKTSDGTGDGSFASALTGLAPGTTYHVRAYAVNAIGTAYGSDVSYHAPTTQDIPTLDKWALILLAGLLCALSYIAFRRVGYRAC